MSTVAGKGAQVKRDGHGVRTREESKDQGQVPSAAIRQEQLSRARTRSEAIQISRF